MSESVERRIYELFPLISVIFGILIPHFLRNMFSFKSCTDMLYPVPQVFSTLLVQHLATVTQVLLSLYVGEMDIPTSLHVEQGARKTISSPKYV